MSHLVNLILICLMVRSEASFSLPSTVRLERSALKPGASLNAHPSSVSYPFRGTSGFLPGFSNPYYDPSASARTAPILTYSSEHPGDGSYTYSFTTGDGKQAQESGFLKYAYIDNAGNPQGTQVVQGSYAYISPEGTPIQVAYTADENGFRTTGVNIPSDGTLTAGVRNPNLAYNQFYNRQHGLNVRNPYNYGSYQPYNLLRPQNHRNIYHSNKSYSKNYEYL